MSLVRASIWLTISELIFNFSGYVIHSVLGRTLGPAEYGRYSLIIFSTMIVVLVGRGIPIAMSKYLSEIRKDNPEQIPHIKKTSALVQVILIGSVTIFYFLFAPVFCKTLKRPLPNSTFQNFIFHYSCLCSGKFLCLLFHWHSSFRFSGNFKAFQINH